MNWLVKCIVSVIFLYCLWLVVKPGVVTSQADKTRFTHFISIPLNLEGNFNEYFEKMKRSSPFPDGLKDAFVSNQRLHLPLLLMTLSPLEKERQLNLITKTIEKNVATFGSLRVKLKGLKSINNERETSVLYICIDPEHKGCDVLSDFVDQISLDLELNGMIVNQQQFIPHVTVFNTKYINQPKKRNGRITFDATRLLDANKNLDWGEYAVNEIHISIDGHLNVDTGYYMHERIIEIK